MKKEILGKSAGGTDIEAFQLSTGAVKLLLIGGVHGDEPEGYDFVERFVADKECFKFLEGRAELWAIPRLNPEGCAREERLNGNGVDLNRNMPTEDWDPVAKKERYQPGPSAASEPETKLLIALIEKLQPRCIVSVHSWEPMINYNGPAEKLAVEMSKLSGYRIADDIGYPTPGSLGTWSGWERKIPTITLEIERGIDLVEAFRIHRDSVKRAFEFAAENEVLG